jgi:hypothetical protein
MEMTNIVDFARRDVMTDALTELLKTGAQALIASAVEAELAGYIEQFSELRTEAGQAAVVRNGYHPARPFQMGMCPLNALLRLWQSKSDRTNPHPCCIPHTRGMQLYPNKRDPYHDLH